MGMICYLLRFTAEQVDRTSDLMDRAIPDGLVTGHEVLIEGLTLPDPGDRHVLAAAIRCHASVIVTFNERDFVDVGHVKTIYGYDPEGNVIEVQQTAPGNSFALSELKPVV